MPDENYNKISTELSIALGIDEKSREKSLDLNVGYEEESKTWTLIVRYIKEISFAAKIVPFKYSKLLSGFAIVTIEEGYIDALAAQPEIIWIEKPKSLVYQTVDAVKTSCISEVKIYPLELSGKGTVTAVIDSGVNIFRREFRNLDGTTKLVGFWNQNDDFYDDKLKDNSPYGRGHFYDSEELNQILSKYGYNPPISIINQFDSSGHGTAICGIINQIAENSSLLVVKMAEPLQGQFPRTTELMEGIDFAISYSVKNAIPVALNISFGNNYGDHASNSILETYINSVATVSKNAIVIGTGNEGTTSRHAQGILGNGSFSMHEFVVSEFESGINLQIWRKYSDIIDIFLISPSNVTIGPFNNNSAVMKYNISKNVIDVINGYPTPYNIYQETYISIIPKDAYIEAGLWRVLLKPKKIIDGRYDIYLPVAGSTSGEVYFLAPSVLSTLTIPSTAERAIAVAAYNQFQNSYASFSGRGYAVNNLIKPDLAAPGVDISVLSKNMTGYEVVSGTSFAAPFVTASAALLMEWGIVENNDPYLYGEKLKAYLISGAKKTSDIEEWPNPKLGWGTLCVADSIPN